MTLGIVRGAFLNEFEMQNFEPLVGEYNITAFGSLKPIHDRFAFPVTKLPSPVDLPNFPYKMPILNRVFTDAHVLFGLEEKLKGFDIAHTAETYYYYTKQCLDAKKRGYVKKVVCTVWENIPFNNEGIHGRKEMKKRAIQEVDYFIAVTEKAKLALIEEGCDSGKIIVIPMGVDLERFRPRDYQKSGRFMNRPYNKGTKILFVGRLEEEKGIVDLLNAFIGVVGERKEKDIRLDIVGQGSLQTKLESLIKENRVGEFIKIFRLPHRGIEKAYQEADIFVLPSKPTKYWQEQFGMVLVEAMACGLPIITTSSGSIPEVVGSAARVVEPGNIKQIGEVLKNLIDSPASRLDLGLKARKRAEELYDRNKVAEKIREIYLNLL